MARSKERSPDSRPIHTRNNGKRLFRVVNRSNGWLVSICLDGKRHHRYFGDETYGSAEGSRRAANEIASRHYELYLELKSLRHRFVVRNTSRSGWPGVSYYEATSTRNAGWLAYWNDPVTGVRSQKWFASKRYGEVEACRLARQTRDEAMLPYRRRYDELLALLEADFAAMEQARNVGLVDREVLRQVRATKADG